MSENFPQSIPSGKIAIEVDREERVQESKEDYEKRVGEEIRAQSRLSDMFAGMIAQNVFYARILSNLQRYIDWNSEMTVGFKIVEGRLRLLYNPNYINNTGHIELMDRLEHECIHVLNNHPKRALDMLNVSSVQEATRELKNEAKKNALNLALDFTVNYELYLQKHKKKPIEGSNWPMANDPDFDFELNFPAEVYYKKLQQELPDPEKMPDGLKGTCTTIGNQHSWFGDENLDEDQTQASFDQVENQLLSAIDKACSEQERARGTVPARYKEMIENLVKSRTIPWYKMLVALVHAAFINEKDPCYSKPLKALLALIAAGEDVCGFPSYKKKPGYTVVFAIDTSGSMGLDDLKLAAGELLGLIEKYPGSRIIVIQCDAAIEKEYELKSLEEINVKTDQDLYDFAGRGGTDFNPPFGRFLEAERPQKKWFAGEKVFEERIADFPTKVDCFVYFTDGYAPAPQRSLDPGCPVYWVITPNGDTNWVKGTFGRFLKINNADEEATDI